MNVKLSSEILIDSPALVSPLAVADTNVCGVTLVEGIVSTTLTVKVFAVTLLIGNHLLLAGSGSTTPLPL